MDEHCHPWHHIRLSLKSINSKLANTTQGGTQMLEIFSHLESLGIITKAGVSERKISTLPFKQLAQVAAMLGSYSPKTSTDMHAPHRYSASIGLSGGAEECAALTCRLERISELARFAILFSDRIYIRNFFGIWTDGDHPSPEDSQDLRRRIYEDLIVLAKIRPLIEAELIIPVAPIQEFCLGCLAKHSFGPDADTRLRHTEKELVREFDKLSEVEVERSDDGYDVTCTVPDRLLDHGGRLRFYDSLPEELAKHPRLQAQLNAGQKIRLSKALKQKLGLHRDIAQEVMFTIHYQLIASQALNAPFLTHIKAHIDFLNKLSGDPDRQKTNQAALKHLTASIPFLDQIPINTLLKMRNKEGDSLLAFREAVRNAASVLESKHGPLTPNTARQIYSDVLAPGLAKLDKTVKAARRDAITSTIKSASAVALALSFGIYLGLLPTELHEAAKLFGLVKAGSDALSKASDALDPERTIHKESLYFLWRLRKLTQ